MNKIYKKKDLFEGQLITESAFGTTMLALVAFIRLKDIPLNKWPHYFTKNFENLLSDFTQFMSKNYGYTVDDVILRKNFTKLVSKALKEYKDGGDTSQYEVIEELVDSKGGKLQGDKHVDQVANATTSKDTTDDHVRKTRQGPSRFFRASYMSDSEDETLDDVANKKMKGVVEDILSKRQFDKDVIDKVKYSNGIPEMDAVKESLPVLVRKISHIKTLLDRDEVGGDEKAILLNSLLSVDLTDVPSQYKRELARKLGY